MSLWFRFKNLDKLIHYVNKDGRVNAFYSTPEEYVKTKHSQGLKWPLKTDDFFPYADCETCYWTGDQASSPVFLTSTFCPTRLLAESLVLLPRLEALQSCAIFMSAQLMALWLRHLQIVLEGLPDPLRPNHILLCPLLLTSQDCFCASLERRPGLGPAGYFTSRPASKGYIKAGTSYLQVTRQLELLTGTPGSSEHLEEAVSLLQHHDSITGTEKQHVANDYHKRLAKGRLIRSNSATSRTLRKSAVRLAF